MSCMAHWHDGDGWRGPENPHRKKRRSIREWTSPQGAYLSLGILAIERFQGVGFPLDKLHILW